MLWAEGRGMAYRQTVWRLSVLRGVAVCPEEEMLESPDGSTGGASGTLAERSSLPSPTHKILLH